MKIITLNYELNKDKHPEIVKEGLRLIRKIDRKKTGLEKNGDIELIIDPYLKAKEGIIVIKLRQLVSIKDQKK